MNNYIREMLQALNSFDIPYIGPEIYNVTVDYDGKK